jgi:energy-coupling factor transport system ATP-binding protein
VALTAEHLRFAYKGAKMPVLEDFSASFPRGELTAVTGPNGCGKTTLAKLLVGILRPSGGGVFVDGEPMAGLSLAETGRKIGLVLQQPERQLFCATVREEMDFGLKYLGLSAEEAVRRREEYLSYFGLGRHEDRFPFELSMGEKQRLVIAATLALRPDYLVLDEPTSSLDLGRRRELGKLLTRAKTEWNVGVALISHDERFLTDFADGRISMGVGGAEPGACGSGGLPPDSQNNPASDGRISMGGGGAEPGACGSGGPDSRAGGDGGPDVRGGRE